MKPKNNLIFQSNNDVPFVEANISIHQPTIKEISLFGDEVFLAGSGFLNFSKNLLDEQDKLDSSDLSDFDIFMSIMTSPEGKEYKQNCSLVLSLLFPSYNISFKEDCILIANDKKMTRIDKFNYDAFKSILVDICELNKLAGSVDYNPADGRAKKIAEKIKKGRDKSAKSKNNGEKKDISLFGKMVSVLSVGEGKDKNVLMNYTIRQLYDEFDRFQRKMNYDFYIEARMNGASDLSEVEHWMND